MLSDLHSLTDNVIEYDKNVFGQKPSVHSLYLFSILCYAFKDMQHVISQTLDEIIALRKMLEKRQFRRTF